MVQPSRAAGRQRVAELLAAACTLIAERGYEATTMADIAAKAGAHIGSLYRFFPNKEAIAETLLQQHVAVMRDAYQTFAVRAEGATPEQLADRLIDVLAVLQPRLASLANLLEARTDESAIRATARAQALSAVASALRICAPALDEPTAQAIGAVVLNNMKVMVGMAQGVLPVAPGAAEEMRLMNRVYLSTRLKPYHPA